MSMKHHNGRYACCYNPGVTIGDDDLHRYWPYDPTADARSHESIMADIKEAMTAQTPVMCIMINLLVTLRQNPGVFAVQGYV